MISRLVLINARRAHCRIAIVQLWAMALITLSVAGQTVQPNNPSSQLLQQFKSERVFWRQRELAQKIVALHDPTVLPQLVGWLDHDDRHLRGNVAFIFAGLGDDRGFGIISGIIDDLSDRPEGQGQGTVSGNGRYNVQQQIRADRYYAVHLFGALKFPRAVPVLIPLLQDPEINYKVAWALGEIGDRSAINPLIESLQDRSPDVRVIAIDALEKIGAREALSHLRRLLNDQEVTHFNARMGRQVSVAEIAREAIAKLEAGPKAN